MTDEARPPFDYENLDVASEGQTSTERAYQGVKSAASGVGADYDQARKPGMPLSVLSNIAREAPLGSLLVAFLLGIAFARRR
jgi:hypothetical protein